MEYAAQLEELPVCLMLLTGTLILLYVVKAIIVFQV